MHANMALELLAAVSGCGFSLGTRRGSCSTRKDCLVFCGCFWRWWTRHFVWVWFEATARGARRLVVRSRGMCFTVVARDVVAPASGRCRCAGGVFNARTAGERSFRCAPFSVWIAGRPTPASWNRWSPRWSASRAIGAGRRTCGRSARFRRPKARPTAGWRRAPAISSRPRRSRSTICWPMARATRRASAPAKRPANCGSRWESRPRGKPSAGRLDRPQLGGDRRRSSHAAGAQGARLLVSDGEAGLAEGLGGLVDGQ